MPAFTVLGYLMVFLIEQLSNAVAGPGRATLSSGDSCSWLTWNAAGRSRFVL